MYFAYVETFKRQNLKFILYHYNPNLLEGCNSQK
jgi:hypothetical protein